MADIAPRKGSCIVTLSKRWDYTAIANCKNRARKTSFDLQKDLMHAWISHKLKHSATPPTEVWQKDP